MQFWVRTPVYVSAVMAVLVLAGSIVCVKCAGAAISATGKNDPGEVVADEFAGQSVALLFAVGCGEPIVVTAITGFLLFRLFDISKPWPIRRLEKLPGGWGVLADDLLAGVYAGIVLLVCLRFGAVQFVSESLDFSDGRLNVIKAAVLGVVQGFTEFLPVSSSGHLVLFETLFKLDPETPQMLLFDLAVHVGTVGAIFIVFRRSITAFVRNILRSGKYLTFGRAGQAEKEAARHRYGLPAGIAQIYKKSPSVRLLILAVFVTLITGACGLTFKKYFEAAFGHLKVVAAMWAITGTVLLVTDARKRTRLGLRRFGFLQAAIVGLAQAVAIMPGISRSGATICAAILVGLHRRWAVEFSFLIAIPAILGATLLEVVKDSAAISADVTVSVLVSGAAAAAICGVLALKVLIKASRGAKLKVFGFYCYILALAVLVYLWV